MICASCGRQVATGARYCIHCGAEQSVPTPIAAVAAASMARRAGREAANAAHAEPARIRPAPAANPFVDDAGAVPAPSGNGLDRAANSEQPTRPAYADAPRRRGLALALIASLAVVAIAVAAVAVWRIDGDRRDVVANAPAAESPAPAARAPAAMPPAPATPSSETTASLAETTPNASTGPPDETQAANTPATPNAPVEIKALPPQAPALRPAHRPQSAKSPAAPAEAPQPAAEPPQAQVAQVPPPIRARPAAPPAASRVSDRWQRLSDELSQCTREDFITRVICGQRARFRYCEGYWGKVPQCPGNPTPERGQ